MSPSPREYLRHILEEARFLAEQSKAVTQEQFLHDDVRQRAFARSLEIVGEAIKNLSPEFRENIQRSAGKPSQACVIS